jgi:hypothetical protein
MELGVQGHTPAALPPEKTRYLLYRRLRGLQGRSGPMGKIRTSLGFDSRNFQLVASRYNDWATQAHMLRISAIYRTYLRYDILCLFFQLKHSIIIFIVSSPLNNIYSYLQGTSWQESPAGWVTLGNNISTDMLPTNCSNTYCIDITNTHFLILYTSWNCYLY